jgi:hypothetical protein
MTDVVNMTSNQSARRGHNRKNCSPLHKQAKKV